MRRGFYEALPRGGEFVIRRGWFLVCAVWALAFLANGSTKVDGIGEGDVWLACAPFACGWLLVRATRFVLTGSPRR
jgi:hypothetical protein